MLRVISFIIGIIIGGVQWAGSYIVSLYLFGFPAWIFAGTPIVPVLFSGMVILFWTLVWWSSRGARDGFPAIWNQYTFHFGRLITASLLVAYWVSQSGECLREQREIDLLMCTVNFGLWILVPAVIIGFQALCD